MIEAQNETYAILGQQTKQNEANNQKMNKIKYRSFLSALGNSKKSFTDQQ